MAKKARTPKEPLDLEDELLNFDLDDLSSEDIVAEDDVIELVELVEPEKKDEDRTRELHVKSRGREKPAAKVTPKAASVKEVITRPPEMVLPEDEEEADLDLSDLTLDMDAEAIRPEPSPADDAITEADLGSLLEEADDDEIAFDLSTAEEGGEAVKEEVTDADLEALLQEAMPEAVEEPDKVTDEEKEILGLVSETEVAGEVQFEEEKAPLEDLELAVESFEETEVLAEPEAAEEVLQPAVAEPEELGAAEAVTFREEFSAEELSAEKLVGISEERLEEIITRVVEEVVERVARETMASVAERVFGQAIEALKASLESSSEEP